MARRRYSLVFLGLVLSMVAASACTKDIEKPNDFASVPTGKVQTGGPDTEGGFPDSARADTGSDGNDGGVCTDLEVVGSQVDKIAQASDAPLGTGGTLVDGIYDLSIYSQYLGISGTVSPTGITARMAIRVTTATSTIEEVSEITTGSANPAVALTRSSYTVAGSAITITGICPFGSSKTSQYTANVLNQITINTTSGGAVEGFTFLKRQ